MLEFSGVILIIIGIILVINTLLNDKVLFKPDLNFIDIDRQISTNQKEINENILKLLKEINNGLDLSNTRISSLEKRLNKLEDKDTKTT